MQNLCVFEDVYKRQAQDGAQVKFAAIDRLGENVTTYISRRGRIGRDASIDWALGIMNAVSYTHLIYCGESSSFN